MLVFWVVGGPTPDCLSAERSLHLNVETAPRTTWCGGRDPYITSECYPTSHLCVVLPYLIFNLSIFICLYVSVFALLPSLFLSGSSYSSHVLRCLVYLHHICLIGHSQKRPLWSKAWCLMFEILTKNYNWGGGKLYRPQIAKSDLPSNHLYDLPPTKSPSPIWCLYDLGSVWFTTPLNSQVWFGVCKIWGLYNLPPPPNGQVWLTLK